MSKRNGIKRLACTAMIATMLSGLISGIAAGAEQGAERGGGEDRSVVSRRVITPDGHNYLEVDGKPVLYNAIELRTDKYHLVAGAPLTDEEVLFDKAKELNYTIVSPILTWRDIEPTLGAREYTAIDQYIDWANEKGLYLDLVWFGINVDSVVWTKFAPPDLWNNPDYPHILNDDQTWKMYGLGAFGQALTMDMSSSAIREREMAVFRDLWQHIEEKDTHHRLISVQIQNETGMQYQFPDDVIVPYIKEMADIVKNSNHSVFTRMNSPKTSLIPAYLQSNIDSLGYDPYTNKIRDSKDPSRGLEYWQNLFSTDGNWYAVHENGAHGMDVYPPEKPDYNVTNVPSLMMYTFSKGSGYNSYHIEDDSTPEWFWNTGMYTRSRFGPANVVDGDDDTYYRSDDLTEPLSGKPAYLLMTMDGITDSNGNIKPGNKTVDRITLKTSSALLHGPTAWTVYTSQDGETYTPQGSISNAVWTQSDNTVESQTIEFPPVDNVNFMKVEITAANLTDDYFIVNELAAYNGGEKQGQSKEAYATSVYKTYDYRGSTQAVKELNEMLNVKDSNGYHVAKLAPGKQASFFNVETSYPQTLYKATKETAGTPISYSTAQGGLGWAGIDYENNEAVLMSSQAGIFTIHSLEPPNSAQAGSYDSELNWHGTDISVEGVPGNYSVSLNAGDVVRLYYKSGVGAIPVDTAIPWVDSKLPFAATANAFGGDSWNWIPAQAPALPGAGTEAHQTAGLGKPHGHSFTSEQGFYVGDQEKLYTYVYIDPLSPPKEIMIAFKDDSGWEHRAYWGQNLIDKGMNGTNSRRYRGAVPTAGQWTRLEIPADLVGLNGKAVWGVSYEVEKGKVAFGNTGRTIGIPVEQSDFIWFDDNLPAGANPVSWGGDTWNWTTSGPAPLSGTKVHQSSESTGNHGDLFENASQPLALEEGDNLIVHVYITPGSIPKQILLHFRTGWDWEHRAYWGERLITQGTDGTESSLRMGDMPEAGKWVKLEIPAASLGLAGKSINGICFELFDGQAAWDAVGKGRPAGQESSSHDAALRALTVKNAVTAQIIPLDQPFNRNTAAHKVSVESSVAGVTISPTTSASQASVKVNGEELGQGKASGPLALNTGDNLISVEVMAKDGTSLSYVVNVQRSEASGEGNGGENGGENGGGTGGENSGENGGGTGGENGGENGGGTGGENGSGDGGAGNPSGSGSFVYVESEPIVTNDGKLSLPAGRAGTTRLNNEAALTVPSGATDRPMQLVISKVTDSKPLMTDKHKLVLLSPVFEVSKNDEAGSFSKPFTLTIAFDASGLTKSQKPAIYYYNETDQVWIKLGGEVKEGKIAVETNRFAKFAVFAEQSEPELPQVIFADITGHWAEKAIAQAAGTGIVTGYADGTFKPDAMVTRAEFTVMLDRVAKPEGEESDHAELNFKDAGEIGAWAKAAIARAVQAGIVTGDADGRFRPGAMITRSEMAVMIARVNGKLGKSDKPGEPGTYDDSAIGNEDTGFDDNDAIPAWAKKSVNTLQALGIVQGQGGNRFAPHATATRAEAVTMLLRLAELQN